MLQLKGIKKDYPADSGTVHALKGIDLNFRESEFVSILGPSGCGKTTMLNIIGGLDKYTEGDLIINSRSTKEYKDRDWDSYRNHSVGFVFQSYNTLSLRYRFRALKRLSAHVEQKRHLKRSDLATKFTRNPPSFRADKCSVLPSRVPL